MEPVLHVLGRPQQATDSRQECTVCHCAQDNGWCSGMDASRQPDVSPAVACGTATPRLVRHWLSTATGTFFFQGIAVCCRATIRYWTIKGTTAGICIRLDQSPLSDCPTLLGEAEHMFKSKKSERLLSEIELLLPNLRALADRAEMIDDIHHRMKLLESISHNLSQVEVMSHNLGRLADTASLLSTAETIIARYLNDGHRIADDVRVDVETISALTLKLQKDLQDLSRRLTDFEARLSG